jgi:hypothetical protein
MKSNRLMCATLSALLASFWGSGAFSPYAGVAMQDEGSNEKLLSLRGQSLFQL